MALVAGQVPVSGYRIPDYSGAAAAGGAAAAAPYQVASGLIGQVGDYFKQQGEKKKLIKQSDVQIDAALKLFPDLAPALQGYRDQLKDENLPLDDRTAIADSISNVINMGIGEMRNAQSMLMEQQKLGLEQQYKAAQLGLQAEKVDIARQQTAKGPAPKFEIRRPTITSPTGEVFEGPELPYDESRGMFFDTKAQKYIADPNLIGTGKEYAPDSAMPSQTSQIGGSLADSIANVAKMSVGKMSTASTPGTQGGKLGCADAVCRIFNQATGEELVPGGTLSTSQMSASLSNDPRFAKIPLDEAQKGDIVLTPRGKVAGHVGIVVDNGKVVSNSSAGFKGGKPGTVTENYSIDSWAKSVAPRNPSKTAAYRYIGGQQMDEVLAMGTPQQQAEVARMIEQGAGMATAQNIPQGAMPTEPSMATQQPQLPQQAAPQWTPPPGFRPARSKGEAVMMTSEQVENLKGQGFRVSAIPNPDGTFMVSGVTTGGSSSGFEVTTPEGTTVRYGGSGGLTQPKVGPGQQLIPDPTSPTGTRVVDVPGGEAEKAAKQEASAAEAEKEKAIQDGAVLIADIDRFIDYTGRMSKLPFASPVRKAFAAIGMEEQAEAENMLKSVKSILKFKTIAELRKASPTGSTGLGQVTQNEFDATADAWGALSIVGNPDIQRERATAVKTRMLDLIHGNQKHRDALLKSGAISQQQYNEIQSQYPGAKQVSQEDANIQRWRKTFTPKPTQ